MYSVTKYIDECVQTALVLTRPMPKKKKRKKKKEKKEKKKRKKRRQDYNPENVRMYSCCPIKIRVLLNPLDVWIRTLAGKFVSDFCCCLNYIIISV